ncbi:SRPBCC family protein [Nonomuraea sp. B5E05]|uniref:SRPBCC family protein n=1 Tax=Nonomuraea sp. B5E05 TaxID=3153569 RepID=UPI0032605CFF
MRIESTFSVPVPVDQAWLVLLDIERVAPCMPGAQLDEVEGNTFIGRVKAKVGPITLTYKGRAEIVDADIGSYTATISARGKDSRGQGTAAATVTMRLGGADGATRVDLATDLDITGRPAQLGHGIMADVADKIVDQFAAALAELLRDEPGPPVREVSARIEHRRSVPGKPRHAARQQPVDVLKLTRGSLVSVLKGWLRRLFGRT